MDKCPVPLTDKHKADDQSFGVGVIRFIRYKIDKSFENLRKQNGKERTRLECRKDV